jgi:hypothetical protein
MQQRARETTASTRRLNQIKSNQIVYSDSCRVALPVTLITRQGSAAGGTSIFWSHVCLALHNTSFDAF